MRVRAAYRIAVNPFGLDPFTPAPLNRIVDTEHEGALRHKSPNEQSEPKATGGTPTPASTAQYPVIVDKTALLAQADDPQTTRDGALARSEHRSQ
jgi:hypothetical protein